MKVTKVGQPKQVRIWQGKCFECGTEFECTQEEGEAVNVPGYPYGSVMKTACPYCYWNIAYAYNKEN